MSVRRRGLAAVAVLLTVLPVTGTAHAVPVVTRACVESNTLTFSPPLSLTNLGGNYTVAWTRTCVVTTVTVTPPGETVQIITDGGAFGGTYFGDCLLVLLNGAAVNLILAGGVYVVADSTATSTSAKGQVLVPDNVCNTSTASGIGPKIEVRP